MRPPNFSLPLALDAYRVIISSSQVQNCEDAMTRCRIVCEAAKKERKEKGRKGLTRRVPLLPPIEGEGGDPLLDGLLGDAIVMYEYA